MFTVEWFFCPDGITPNSGLTGTNNTYIYIFPHTKYNFTCKIPCPHQLSINGKTTVSVAKMVPPLLAPPAALPTRQGIVLSYL